MALKAKLTKDEFEQLAEAQRGLYKESGNDYLLDAEGVEDVTGLKSALDSERKARAEAEKGLKAEREKFKDVDPEKYAAFLAAEETRETDELKSKGQIDELIEKGKAREKKLVEDWQAKYDALQRELNDVLVDQRLRSAFEKAGVIPDRIDDAVMLTKPSVKLTDKREIQILKDGTPLDASVETYAKELLKEAKPWLYQASGAAGSGAPSNQNGGANGKKTVTRKQLADMVPAAASAVMADARAGKVQLVD